MPKIKDAIWQLARATRANPVPATIIGLLIILVACAIDPVANVIQTWLGIGEKNGKFEVIKSLAISIGFIPVIWLAWSSEKRARAMEDTVANDRQDFRQKRLNSAIEHLGHESESVRIGGIHGLFQLALTYPQLRPIVLGVFRSHVRRKTIKKSYQEENKSRPSEEIQTIVSLLSSKNHGVFESYPINLRWCYLVGVEIDNGVLRNVDFSYSDLRHAKITNTVLDKATIAHSDFKFALFHKISLKKATIQLSFFQGARMIDVELDNTTCLQTNFAGASWFRCSFSNAGLFDVDMKSVHSWNTYLDTDHLAVDARGIVCLQEEEDNFGLIDLEKQFESRILDMVDKESNFAGADKNDKGWNKMRGGHPSVAKIGTYSKEDADEIISLSRYVVSVS